MSYVDERPSNTAPDSPVFVLLHGNPTWSFLYRDLISKLRSKYRVIAPDMIGFGLSDKPDDPGYHTLARHIQNLTVLIDTLDLQNVVMVLNGWGGPVGLGYAISFPANIKHLVLANTWAANLPPLQHDARPLAMRLADWGHCGRLLDSLLNISVPSLLSSRSGSALSDQVLEAYGFPFARRTPRTAIMAFARMFFRPDPQTLSKMDEIQTGLRNVTAPADILWGLRDPLLSKLPAYLLRDDLRNAREPVWLPDVSHYVPEAAPEQLAETVLATVDQKKGLKAGGALFKILK
ncbi:MAG: alpha/beta fold hydrolase [Terriglobales bacterium]|jgi:haloalkane dehalogenase